MKCRPSLLILLVIFTSCDFDINDSPGKKYSYSVNDSKSHGTFICEYKIKDSTINGIGISSIFAEHQYSRDEGILLKKEIDCCNAQLLILGKSDFSTQTTGYDVDWKIVDFINPSPGATLIYRNYKGIILPDSIPLEVISLKGKDSDKVIKKPTLYKVKQAN